MFIDGCQYGEQGKEDSAIDDGPDHSAALDQPAYQRNSYWLATERDQAKNAIDASLQRIWYEGATIAELHYIIDGSWNKAKEGNYS